MAGCRMRGQRTPTYRHRHHPGEAPAHPGPLCSNGTSPTNPVATAHTQTPFVHLLHHKRTGAQLEKAPMKRSGTK